MESFLILGGIGSGVVGTGKDGALEGEEGRLLVTFFSFILTGQVGKDWDHGLSMAFDQLVVFRGFSAFSSSSSSILLFKDEGCVGGIFSHRLPEFVAVLVSSVYLLLVIFWLNVLRFHSELLLLITLRLLFLFAFQLDLISGGRLLCVLWGILLMGRRCSF